MINEVNILQHIPKTAGIYLFKDKNNTILYIGKAKDIRKRVSSYFAKQKTDWKIAELIKEHTTIDYIATQGEIDALLLEAQMIRDYQPKYNVLLKSGDPFLYMLFTEDVLPTVKLVRIKKEKGKYFGPFLYKQGARRGFDYIMRTFKLKLCNVEIENGCLNFHLGNCAGMCSKNFDIEAYKSRLLLAQQALEGNSSEFLKTVHALIAESNKKLEFETSKQLSEYIHNLETIFAVIKTRFSEKKYDREIAQAVLPFKRTPEALQHGLVELQELLELDTPIRSIDCFDISHFQSIYITGSCIRFTDGRPDKNNFRRFKIKTLTQQNDYAALYEIVRRRYRDPDNLPDLIIIDGGKGQLNAVKHLVGTTPIVSLAKREERLFISSNPEGIVLDMQTSMGQLIIALRDYAHHFAISYHQLLRKKNALLEKA